MTPDKEFDKFDNVPLIQIPVDNGPITGIEISPDGGRLMVTNYGRDSVSVIDTDTCRVVETIDDVNEPFAIAMGGADTDRAYVSTVSTAYDSIVVIDTSANAVIATHPVALSVSDLAVSPDGKYVYAVRNGAAGADVAVLDTATDKFVEVIEIASSPGTTADYVRVSSDGARLYVGTNGSFGGQLVIIETRPQPTGGRGGGRSGWRKKKSSSRSQKGAQKSTRTPMSIVGTIEIGFPVRDVAVSPDGDTAYVASCGPDFGAVLDVVDARTNKIAGTHKIGEIGGLLTGLLLSGDGTRAYLVSDDRLTMLCTRTHEVVGTVRVSRNPSCAVESPDGKYLYIADYSGVVTVTPVAATTAPDTQLALESNRSVEWPMLELLQDEPALV
jgi:YVTN family beta-propeller protein